MSSGILNQNTHTKQCLKSRTAHPEAHTTQNDYDDRTKQKAQINPLSSTFAEWFHSIVNIINMQPKIQLTSKTKLGDRPISSDHIENPS